MAWLNLTMANQIVKDSLKANNNIKITPVFHSAKSKQIFQSWSRFMGMCHFRDQNGPFVLNKTFLSTNHCYCFHLPIGPFHCAIHGSCGSRVMRMRNFCAQNGPFPQMGIFLENLLMSLVSFIHANLHAKNQSQILIY